MNGRNQRIIDPEAITRNLLRIRASLPQKTGLIAVVKADGYGHGAVQTAKAAIQAGAAMLAVASVSEGVSLLENGIRGIPVLVLGAVMSNDVAEGIAHRLIQTVCSPEMVFLCEQAAKETGNVAEVHLKVDTGMGRIGVRTETETKSVLEALAACPHVKMTGAFTHFSDADGDESGLQYTERQFERFIQLTEALPKGIVRHCANSATIHRMPEKALDLVRAGISMYGYPPVPTDLPLEPCMKWVAQVSYIKDIGPGEYLSYGRTFQSDRPMRVATVTCGYADGYHRKASAQAEVLIRGKRFKVIGRICMDQMLADISGAEEIRTGDEVVLMGKSGNETISAEDIARWADTISYEILTSAGRRVERFYRPFD